MNKKLKGFTILEVLMSLIIISILMALSYTLINMIGKQMILYERDNSQILDYNLFNTTLKSDIENSNDFEVYNHKLRLEYYDDSTVSYEVSSPYIIREKNYKIDTFKVHVEAYDFNQISREITTFNLTINLLNSNVNANYFLKNDMSEIINNKYFNED